MNATVICKWREDSRKTAYGRVKRFASWVVGPGNIWEGAYYAKQEKAWGFAEYCNRKAEEFK